MRFQKSDHGYCEAAFQSSVVDPSLDGYVSPRFDLQVSFMRVRTILVSQSALDVHRMRVVAFDQVGIIAVHRPDQLGERFQDTGGQARSKSCRLLGQIRPDP